MPRQPGSMRCRTTTQGRRLGSARLLLVSINLGPPKPIWARTSPEPWPRLQGVSTARMTSQYDADDQRTPHRTAAPRRRLTIRPRAAATRADQERCARGEVPAAAVASWAFPDGTSGGGGKGRSGKGEGLGLAVQSSPSRLGWRRVVLMKDPRMDNWRPDWRVSCA
jgi:hypothetical protein